MHSVVTIQFVHKNIQNIYKIYTKIHRNTQKYTRIHKNTQKHTKIHKNIQMYTNTYSDYPEYPNGFLFGNNGACTYSLPLYCVRQFHSLLISEAERLLTRQ